MPDKGFLVRGSLRPAMGSTTGTAKFAATSRLGKPMPVGKPTNNRIPSSISLKRNNGKA